MEVGDGGAAVGEEAEDELAEEEEPEGEGLEEEEEDGVRESERGGGGRRRFLHGAERREEEACLSWKRPERGLRLLIQREKMWGRERGRKLRGRGKFVRVKKK